jgi:hypothetical protein
LGPPKRTYSFFNLTLSKINQNKNKKQNILCENPKKGGAFFEKKIPCLFISRG